jgi:hypothetical protein
MVVQMHGRGNHQLVRFYGFNLLAEGLLNPLLVGGSGSLWTRFFGLVPKELALKHLVVIFNIVTLLFLMNSIPIMSPFVACLNLET